MQTMTEELVHLIERRFRYLDIQEDSLFIRELRRTMTVLRGEPRLALILQDEETEARELFSSFMKHCAELVEQLKNLRNQFVIAAPAHDDSAPLTLEPNQVDTGFDGSLRKFDSLLAGGVGLGGGRFEDRGTVTRLVLVLKNKVQFAIQGMDEVTATIDSRAQLPRLYEIQSQIQNIRTRQTDAWRAFVDDVLTSPGATLLYFDYALRQVRSSVLEDAHPLAKYFGTAHGLPSAEWLSKFLYDDSELLRSAQSDISRSEKAQFSAAVKTLKVAASRVKEGVLLRIGAMRSLQAIFDRFKIRCEWRDRNRLIGLASSKPEPIDAADTTPKRSKPEAILTDELALYLFDQGLNPLTEVPTGGLRPDVLAPGRLYVEAKQYEDRNPKSYLIKGIHQMHETVGRLRGTEWQVREAFYVVFRRGGPLVVMPESVRCGDWTLFPRLIDLAPAAVSGSKAGQRVEISEEELKPREDILTPST